MTARLVNPSGGPWWLYRSARTRPPRGALAPPLDTDPDRHGRRVRTASPYGVGTASARAARMDGRIGGRDESGSDSISPRSGKARLLPTGKLPLVGRRLYVNLANNLAKKCSAD